MGWLDFLKKTLTALQPYKKLRRALREAEQLAGVTAVRGRSFHAFNRAFATDAEDHRAASSQSG
jgi:integrase